MQVYKDSNRYHCFHKECSAGNGDVIDFIEKMENISKKEAIEKAKEIIGILPESKDSKEAQTDQVYSQQGTASTSGSSSVAGMLDTSNPEHLQYRDESLGIDILGGIQLMGLDRLRCTLKIKDLSTPNKRSLRHSLDLYNDDQIQKLIRKTAERLELGTSIIESSLQKLTDQLEAYRLERIEEEKEATPKTPPLTTEEKEEAIAFLKQPNLMQRTNELLGESGIVGEEINRQILWLVYSSRKLSNPLHVICLGASGTGKTYLQEKVARYIIEEEKFTFTSSTGNAFYYLEPYDLYHKLVLIEDMDGAQYLLYPLRELQTKHWINRIVPIKDSQGITKTKKLEVYGPICLSGTTTQEKLYEDNANRCLLLHLDNSPHQQEQIMDYQRKLFAGKINIQKEREATGTLQNIQRVLKPTRVINPYAEKLKIPSYCFKPLRTNQHYLQFIETVTWYHQYQREEKIDKETGEVYIQTTLEDIAIANHLIKDVLLTKSDELPKSIRSLFEQIKAYLKRQNQDSFYSKALRQQFRIYPMKLSRYIRTLVSFGYISKKGGNKKQGYEYQISQWEEYEELQNGINQLDKLLENLKNQQNNQE